MDRRQFMQELYVLAQAFENHWNRSQRADPESYPNELPDGEWWEQFVQFCNSFDQEPKDGD